MGKVFFFLRNDFERSVASLSIFGNMAVAKTKFGFGSTCRNEEDGKNR